ncbi:Clp protease ClpP [Kerstersia gyiorum]|uniref:head maturation protease, ClpP-related n=1 Tax=Kerstersia gyiorum TaxID=206506 RepID=UPI0021502FA0|nr:head maturation protease, ClpP-related [Kerstersia gyiorum]MCR4158816.1 Clp protease ClpP [Kerstersia gyiorum]
MEKPKINLPAAGSHSGVKFCVPEQALARWNPQLQATDSGDNSISILDVIGYDWWTGEGVTAKRIAGALRQIGADADIEVIINSPGGDMFEGVAIYNLLREHKGHVTVKIIGVAASAASIIAMAGDTIQIGLPSFVMIHNGWIVAVGNRHELREAADWMEPFDAAMVDVYEARAQVSREEIQSMMDKETWMGGKTAIEKGFADDLLGSDLIKQGEGKASASAVRRIEAALRSSNIPRSEAQRLIHDFKSSLSDSAGNGGHSPSDRSLSDSARENEAKGLIQSMLNTLSGGK